MTFEIYEVTQQVDAKLALTCETMKCIARRDQSEVKAEFHDMKLGSFRELSPGCEICRVA